MTEKLIFILITSLIIASALAALTYEPLIEKQSSDEDDAQEIL